MGTAGERVIRNPFLTVVGHDGMVWSMSDTDLLTTTQAGVILGKSGRTVARMIEAGTLAAVAKLPGPNGAHLLRRSDVLALLEAAS